jgi:hypothetical protein
MAPYRQSCSACVGRSATAYHDLERYERDVRVHRSAERVARARAQHPDLRDGIHDGTPQSWVDEADYHAEKARTADRLLTRARGRVLASFSVDGCVLCGGTGYIQAPGTFVRGAQLPKFF